MTDLDDPIKSSSSTSDLSRARQRKLRRDQGSSAINNDIDARQVRSKRQERRKGPSLREQLVEAHITLPEHPIESIQGKLSSALDFLTSDPEDGSSTRSRSMGESHEAGSPRRKSAARRSEVYPATPDRTQTQRKSRSDSSYQPQKSKRTFDARSESSPPVMVRGGMGGMAFGRTATSRINKRRTPKRRYDVPLSIPGAEVRLPSIPMVHLGWRAISLLIVMMMAASLFMAFKAPMFQVNTIEAKGLQRLTTGDLNAVLGTFGKSVFGLDSHVLKLNLQESFPELSKISVKIGLPATVKVVVEERVPVISWTQDGNETWVDAQGISFPARGTPQNTLVKVEGHGTPPGMTGTPASDTTLILPPGFPTSTPSSAPTLRLSPELVASILALGAKMPADTLLVYDSEHGLGWNDPKGWEVFFGAEDQDMAMKLDVYQALVTRLQNDGIQPAMISVEYVHAPYYRMER